MSVKRRLAAAGMPAAGVTVFAALALTGQPASAAPVERPVPALVQRATEPTATCDASARIKCGYGDTDDSDYGSDDNGPGANGSDDNDSGADNAVDDDRGNDGYGGVSPSTAPTTASPTPSTTRSSGGKDEVPPGGEAPATVSPGSGAADDILPVTGAPVAAITTVGALIAAAGAAILVGLRRRRNA